MQEHVASLGEDRCPGSIWSNFEKFGLYFLQETAFLIGFWENEVMATLANSAQHQCVDTANNYPCSASLNNVHTIQNNCFNCVNQWKPILLTSPLCPTCSMSNPI